MAVDYDPSILDLDVDERILYLRGMLPYPLKYKGFFGVNVSEDMEGLRKLASKRAGIIIESTDGFEVYLSDATSIAELFPVHVRRSGVELSDKASLVLTAAARGHGDLMTGVIRGSKASHLMSTRKKVDRGRPPLRVEVDLCFLQAGVGSLLQSVLHAANLYDDVDEEMVFKAIRRYLPGDPGRREAARIIGSGIRDLDRITSIILKKCR
jgi:hypothetical protein